MNLFIHLPDLTKEGAPAPVQRKAKKAPKKATKKRKHGGRGPDKVPRTRTRTRPESATIAFRIEKDIADQFKALPDWRELLRECVRGRVSTHE